MEIIGNLYRENKTGACQLVKANISSVEAKGIMEAKTWPQGEVAVFVVIENNDNWEMNREMADLFSNGAMVPSNGLVH